MLGLRLNRTSRAAAKRGLEIQEVDLQVSGAGDIKRLDLAWQVQKGDGSIVRRVDAGALALIEPVAGTALRVGVGNQE